MAPKQFKKYTYSLTTLDWFRLRRWPSKLKFSTACDDGRHRRPVFLVGWDLCDFCDNVVESTNYTSEHDVFPCNRERDPGISDMASFQLVLGRSDADKKTSDEGNGYGGAGKISQDRISAS